MSKLDAGSKPSTQANFGSGRVFGRKIILALAGLILAYPDYLQGQDDKGQPFRRSILGQSPPEAQKKSIWIGKRVVQKYKNLPMIRAEDTFETIIINKFIVKEVDKQRLFVQIEGKGDEYWVQADDVVRFEDANTFFTREIKFRPAYYWNYQARSLWRKEMNDFDRALEDVNRAIWLYPEGGNLYSDRGLIWKKLRKYDNAIDDFNHAIQLYPNFFTLEHRAATYVEMKQFDAALADATESIRLEPLYAGTYATRGSAWFGKKEYAKAMADLNRAIEIDQYLVDAYFRRGGVLKAMREYNKAILDCEKAVRLSPSHNESHWLLAWILATCPDAKLRDGKKAVMLATKACELSKWRDFYDLHCLAAAYAETGEFDSAVKWQRRADSLNAKAEDKSKGIDRIKLYREGKPYHEPAS
jgi:tetratricopeptide (TPR) repeat protein